VHAAHQRSRESSRARRVALAASLASSLGALAACSAPSLAESVWPPADFEIVVEELRFAGVDMRVQRRFRARADGVVVYACAPVAVQDELSGAAWPVFERMSVYRLVPTCIRALARRVHRLGVLELDRAQGDQGPGSELAIRLSWRAFEQARVVTTIGRAHGALAEILRTVAEYLPDGERFELKGIADRPVTSVLRGVPGPADDARGALTTLRGFLADAPDDTDLMLDCFALACRGGERAVAEELLQQWSEATVAARRQQEQFPEEGVHLTPAILARMLPARDAGK
jgi:hypothetical protein